MTAAASVLAAESTAQPLNVISGVPFFMWMGSPENGSPLMPSKL